MPHIPIIRIHSLLLALLLGGCSAESLAKPIQVSFLNTEEKHLPEILLATLKARWAQLEVVFPKNMIITMLHAVDAIKSCRIVTDHTGLLIPTANGYMYLEKAGGCGPFLRMDISDIADLTTYYKAFVTKESKGDMTHYLMTLNDEEIYEVYP